MHNIFSMSLCSVHWWFLRGFSFQFNREMSMRYVRLDSGNVPLTMYSGNITTHHITSILPIQNINKGSCTNAKNNTDNQMNKWLLTNRCSLSVMWIQCCWSSAAPGFHLMFCQIFIALTRQYISYCPDNIYMYILLPIGCNQGSIGRGLSTVVADWRGQSGPLVITSDRTAISSWQV